MICFYLSKTKCFDITEIKQDSQSDLFQPLFNENFIKIDIFCRNILTLMKQHVTMKQGPIYSGFVCFNFKKRKKRACKGLAAMTLQIFQANFYRCLDVLAIKMFLSTYIFNFLSKNNSIKFPVCTLGEDD